MPTVSPSGHLSLPVNSSWPHRDSSASAPKMCLSMCRHKPAVCGRLCCETTLSPWGIEASPQMPSSLVCLTNSDDLCVTCVSKGPQEIVPQMPTVLNLIGFSFFSLPLSPFSHLCFTSNLQALVMCPTWGGVKNKAVSYRQSLRKNTSIQGGQTEVYSVSL